MEGSMPHKPKKVYPYPDYALHPKVGDVWRMRSGHLRVVRATAWGDHIYFSIRRCSWTTRPYTIYYGRELWRMGCRLVTRGIILRRPIDKKLIDAINHEGASFPHGLTCHIVAGIP